MPSSNASRAVFVTLAGALVATFTVTLMGG
jgi:hypothetical protein